MAYSNTEVEKIINEFGLKNKKHKFKCLNPLLKYDKTCRIVLCQSLETGEVLSTRFDRLKNGQNPFLKNKFSNKEVELIINKIGQKADPQFTCVNPNAGKCGNMRLVAVKCLITQEIKKYRFSLLKNGQNPFTRSSKMYKLLINQKGKKNQPQYSYVSHDKKFVTIRSNEGILKKISRKSIFKINPFLFYLYQNQLSKKINNFGKSQNPPFKFKNLKGKNHRNRTLIEVQNLLNNSTKIVPLQNITYHKLNPFSHKSQNQIEINKLHPKVLKIAQSLGYIKININFGKQGLIDLVLQHKNLKKLTVIEIKRSDRFHSYNKEQRQRYLQIANNPKNNIGKIYFTDPIGKHKKHGYISFSELYLFLKKDLN